MGLNRHNEASAGADNAGMLFIVGVGRSGTTLLRELLSQHSQIDIPFDELQIISRLINKLGEQADFSDKKTVDAFIEIIEKGNFRYHLDEKGIDLNLDELRSELIGTTWRQAISALLRQCIPHTSTARYLGEKTPTNLLEIERFSRVFGDCYFIHIVRDPRDVCVSMRKAWSKSLYRGAACWITYQKYYSALEKSGKFHGKILKIHYENLVAEPEPTLRSVCEFLGIDFERKMLHLRHAAEQWGDAAGTQQIVSGSKNKFLQSLSRTEIELIEGITWPILNSENYEPQFAKTDLPINKFRYQLYGVNDLMGGIIAQIKRKGLMAGIKYRLRQIGSN